VIRRNISGITTVIRAISKSPPHFCWISGSRAEVFARPPTQQRRFGGRAHIGSRLVKINPAR
jgi:hypothetical protein